MTSSALSNPPFPIPPELSSFAALVFVYDTIGHRISEW